MEKVEITTEDGMRIYGLYRSPAAPQFAILLLHMMPATKESWDTFAEALHDEGIASLAIDERGHGESIMKDGEKIDYREFTDEEQQAKRLDVEASSEWLLRKTGLMRNRIGIVGASIGANLAIRYALAHAECPLGVAMSPGIDYHGVLTEDAVAGLAKKQPLLIIVSDEDITSALSVKKLEALETKGERTVMHLHEKGHGTTMFETDTELMRHVIEWITSKL